MNAYRKRFLSGRLAAASNSSSHSRGISVQQSWSLFCEVTSRLGPLRANNSAWVGAGDDFADAGLIEALVAVVALEDFHVRTKRTLASKSRRLLLGDAAIAQQPLDA